MNAIIQVNTKELVEKLEDLGYISWSIDHEDIGLVAGEFNFRAQSFSLPDRLELCIVSFQCSEDIEDFVSHGYIDCGKNEDLFLAVAALREDTDHKSTLSELLEHYKS